ncbi:protein aurora borealis isoform X1 [Parasteatoda tepidariorum]|uniref:protein aurora borealis isoform X1 n=1 Tax=Parasteatoda tepidariorum TaxID=114398 RepID=UPI001C71DC14|nr:protein aurora borealis isoform X1 [Parasteatoda tepidariorum]XP_042894666.1 protein aurora borealis isoform X1 [Parasteatoda tepidariorum]XP_042894668.1 protein aurora borealis isoform X1 [Parasteatoda tepidariorum]
MNNANKQICSSILMNTSSDLTPKRKASFKGSTSAMMSISEENSTEREKTNTPRLRNPFDVKAESLYFHSCSPFFATLSRNKKDDGTFRWSIEQLSVLCPADIDETSMPDICVDAEQEMKAQEAIDTFFSQNSIVPSPWSDPSDSGGRLDVKVRRMNHMVHDRPVTSCCDTATQTALSIPPDVDLKSILGQYFTFNDEEESFSSRENSREEVEVLSASSLRRKLFTTEEECISPPRTENKNLFRARLWSTPTSKMHSNHSTPASDVLSSSPITPPNCSESCNILSSPPVSPITADRLCTSVQMKSFDEQNNSEIYYSPQNCPAAPETAMSFLTESQEVNSFPASTSEKQDTGYVTGSISSSQNMNFSEVNNALVSRITPVTELMEDCELSSSACDMSYRNTCPSICDSISFDGFKTGQTTSCTEKTHPWLPTCSSTPAPGFHNV